MFRDFLGTRGLKIHKIKSKKCKVSTKKRCFCVRHEVWFVPQKEKMDGGLYLNVRSIMNCIYVDDSDCKCNQGHSLLSKIVGVHGDNK